jgi:prephenate dehydrogenase
VGLTPVINFVYLEKFEFGPETAQSDLFKDCLMFVVSGRQANEKAVNMAANFAQLLGASPYFTDPAEIDGLMTMTHIMPRLLAASLLKLAQEAPGWREARKVAGKTYTQVTNPLIQDDIPAALAASVIYNQENTNRIINDLIRILVEFRDLTEVQGQAELEEVLKKLQSDRDIWWLERRESRWIEAQRAEIPQKGVLSRLFGFRRPKTPKGE